MLDHVFEAHITLTAKLAGFCRNAINEGNLAESLLSSIHSQTRKLNRLLKTLLVNRRGFYAAAKRSHGGLAACTLDVRTCEARLR